MGFHFKTITTSYKFKYFGIKEQIKLPPQATQKSGSIVLYTFKINLGFLVQYI